MDGNEKFKRLLGLAAAQADAYEKREKSRAEKHYGDVMQQSAIELIQFTRTASFDELMLAEKTFQKNGLIVYAKHPATMKVVQEGIDDLKDGDDVYKQLIEDTEAYKAYRYRKKESIPPENVIPLDAMRRALRGQVKRVENYRSNVMGNPQEQEFMSARIAMRKDSTTAYNVAVSCRPKPNKKGME